MHAVFICSTRKKLKVQEEGCCEGFITFFLSSVSELNQSVVSAFLKDSQDCLSINEAPAVMGAPLDQTCSILVQAPKEVKPCSVAGPRTSLGNPQSGVTQSGH